MNTTASRPYASPLAPSGSIYNTIKSTAAVGRWGEGRGGLVGELHREDYKEE